MNKRALVGMSGGVDSSAAAYLLKEAGYEVIGATMNMWGGEEGGPEARGRCCGLSEAEDARRVADAIGIKFYVINMKDVFKNSVIANFTEEYKRGRTPNPCVVCNRRVKWEAFLRKAEELGADFIATGHYAGIRVFDETGRLAVCAAKDARKDQSYALYNLTQAQLSRTLLPLGGYLKTEIRDIAEKIGLCVARKPDSQEICFIPDDDYGRFLKSRYGEDFGRGYFEDSNGVIIGEHNGFYNYTIGQRRGLGAGFGKRLYVTKVNPVNFRVTLGGDGALYAKTAIAEGACFMAAREDMKETRVKAKIRYNHEPAGAVVSVDGGFIRCEFDEPQRAIAPGQPLVCYKGGFVYCGGTIVKALGN
jgi:tRNA-specific 2-thiouridylase